MQKYLSFKNIKLTTDEKINLSLLFFLVLLIYIIRSKFYNISFERDEGAYSYYGKLLLEGKIPYKDFYEQKFPGVFYFFALIVGIFGSTVSQLHFGFMLLNIITVTVIYFSVNKIFNSTAAIISAATYTFTSLTPMISGFTIQSEHGVAFFASLGFFCFTFSKRNNKWLFYLLMGICFGIAFMVKTSGVFFALWGAFVIILEFFFFSNKNYLQLAKYTLSYAVGGFSVLGILFFLIYRKGSFTEMLYWTIDMPKYYVNRMPLEEGLKYFGYTKDAIFQFNKFLWVHALFSIIIIFVKSINWHVKIAIISFGLFSFLTIVPGYYFYGHYWLQLLPGLSILAGATCFSILKLLSEKFNLNHSYLRYIYLGLFSVILYSHVNKFKQYYFKPNHEQIMRNTYGNNPFPETLELAKQMNAFMKPNDEVVIIGSEPEFFIYTNKKSPTRHIFFSTIVADVPQHKEWQREYSKDIEKTKPKYLLYYNIPISLLVQPNTDKYIFEWANKYITDNYNIIGVVDMIPGQRANYIWREQLNGFKPQAQEQIYIYEKKL